MRTDYASHDAIYQRAGFQILHGGFLPEAAHGNVIVEIRKP